MSFADLGLAAELVRAVHEEGYTTPTSVQAKAIPVILEGKDVLAGAQTGTGKTAGFALPLLQRLSQLEQPSPKQFRPIRALVLTPTRELASQVSESIRKYGKYSSVRSNVVFGGVKISPQIFKLRRGVDVLVATPGRLLDLVHQGEVDLGKVEILVLDEADRMLDMGFMPDIKRILAKLPKQRQNLLFSATYSTHIKQLADGLLQSPVTIDVARRNSIADTVSHIVHPVARERKRQLLSELIGSRNLQQVLVFTKTKMGAERLSKQLIKDGLRSTSIHGDKSQGARTKALADFKDGRVRVLVATDVAARGIDINQLSHVINFELPMVAEDYIHRIGRTGRAGNSGEAISLVCSDERKLLNAIEQLLKREVKREVIEGYEPDFSLTGPHKDKSRANPRGKPRHRHNGGNSANKNTGNSSERSSSKSSRFDNKEKSGSSKPGGEGKSKYYSKAKPGARTASGNARPKKRAS
ncbi:ATP-dependent RNA helicase RhlE [Aurantivibrio infirmus]